MLRDKKAQVFVEFFILALVSITIFMIFLASGIKYGDSIKEKNTLERMELLLEDFKLKVLVAADSVSDFESEIILPDTINDKEYQVDLEKSVIIIQLEYDNNSDLVASKLLPDLTGEVQKGCNLITKTDEGIEVGPC